MDKQAFKQRMQNLKSYRENNPGKGYWDWRNSLPDNLKYTDDTEYNMRGAYESGAQPILENDGFYHLPTRNPQTGEILKTSLHPTFWKGLAEDAKIGYNTYFVGDKVYTKSKEEGPINVYADGGEVGNPSVQAIQQKQWLNDWLKSRSKQMAENIDFYSNQNVYGSSMDRMHVSPFFFQDKEKNAAKIIQEQLQYANNIPIYDYREPWVAANKNIPNRKEILKMNSGVQGAYHKKYRQPHTISVSPIATDRSVILHELSHSTQDKYSIQSSKIDDILKRHQKENHNYDKYYDNPDEVYSRMNQFRYDNNIKPEDIITEEQIEQWKDSSIDNQFINRYSTNTLLDLLNSVARAFENGGEVTRKSLKDIRKESTIGDKLDYNVMLQNQNTYQKEFATNWYKERAKNTKYRSQLGDGKLDKILSDIDKATWKNPTEAMKDNLISQGYTPTEQNIKSQLQAINAKGTKGFAVPSMYSYYGAPRNTWHEGIGHIVGDNNPAILDSTPNVSIPSNDPKYYDYVNQANEKHAQTWDFRGKNQTLKDDTGNYYIDPNRQLTPEDISNMRSKGAKIPEQWESLKDADISELTNTFAYNLSQDPIYYMASGGEVGDPDDKFAKAVNTKLGRTPDGRPLQQGLKPVFDLEDAANLTPVGDVITTKDIYNSVKESDWSNAGLAALTLLPFVPSGIRNIKAATRYVPSVNKGLDQRMLDNAFNSIKEKREYLSDVANERNRVLESVNGYAHRVRAQKADQMFGTNYNETYDLLSDLYEHHFFDLPEVQAKDMPQIGKMEAKASAKTRYNDTGVGAGPNDFDFLVNVDRPIDAKEIARHEMNHYTDYLISRNPNTTTNNNMLKQLESSLKNTDEKEYFRRGTEQKAYMNQLRARMYEDGAISSLDELVTPSMIKSYIDKLGDKDSIKRAYKQHKSLSSYTKWFNSIPLLGVGAIGVNKYFNNGTEQEK